MSHFNYGVVFIRSRLICTKVVQVNFAFQESDNVTLSSYTEQRHKLRMNLCQEEIN
jgi:hypothetical protein